MVDEVAVSTELNEAFFACDVAKCKGACCVEGDLGAPLEKKELAILEEIYEQVEPYLTEKGKAAIEDQGLYVYEGGEGYSTPLVNGRECAYVTFTDNGIALCGIEKAYLDGKIDFQKPVSCHLYPVRVLKAKGLEALNYDRWSICAMACSRGEAEQIRVYEFVKDGLVRMYGQAFYDQLDEIANALHASEEACE